MESDAIARRLRRLEFWVAVAGIGVLVVGVALAILAGSFAYAIAKEDFGGSEDEFADLAQQHFEQGRLDDLAALITERSETHPNDANAFWYRARLRALRGEWDGALADLCQVGLLEPSWNEDYVRPLEAEILERQRAATPSPEPKPTIE